MKNIHGLKLHEMTETEKGSDVWVMRVVGGWIYTLHNPDGHYGNVFVPLADDSFPEEFGK